MALLKRWRLCDESHDSSVIRAPVESRIVYSLSVQFYQQDYLPYNFYILHASFEANLLCMHASLWMLTIEFPSTKS